jgi:hypothetical protein
LAGAPLFSILALSLIGAGLIWPMLANVDPPRPETALAAFKRNALIGAAAALAFAAEPAWRTLRPHFGW